MNPKQHDPDFVPAPAEDLGKSYETLLGDQTWDVDAGASFASEPTPPDPPEGVAPPPLIRILEALLFVGGAPLTAARACEIIRGLLPAQFVAAVDTLNDMYRRQGRPYTAQLQGEGYVLALRPAHRPIQEKLYGAIREVRLSPAAVDVLALVAYRQPATKQEIDGLRGTESGAVLRQLVRRGLIAIVQRGEAGRREICYGTTARFLEFFGLKSLDDLPRAQDLQSL